MASAELRVYGVSLSQPFRSVVWALLQKKEPFSIETKHPGSNKPNGTLCDNYRSLTKQRVTSIPLLQVDNTHFIFESPAILTYLCETRDGWADLYAPAGTIEKARIDSYLHWHHGNARKLSRLVAPFLRRDLELTFPSDKELSASISTLTQLNEAWLAGGNADAAAGPYLANDRYSIADILLYGEISQIVMTDIVSMDPYPNIRRWMGHMKERPFHNAVHTALVNLGTLTSIPTPRMVSEASSAGLQAIRAAQDSYNPPVDTKGSWRKE